MGRHGLSHWGEEHAAIAAELDAAGLTFSVERGGKHPRFVVSVNGRIENVGVPCTSSDKNAWRKGRARVRRLIRQWKAEAGHSLATSPAPAPSRNCEGNETMQDTANDIVLRTVHFHGRALETFDYGGEPCVALKPIVAGMGIDWNGQYQRVKRDPVLGSVMCATHATGADGKRYEMQAIPLRFLNGFLFGIDAARVKPELRETVIAYQRECYDVLADYWMQGAAVNPRHDVDAIFDLMVDQGRRSSDMMLDTRKAVVEHVESSKSGVMGYVKRNVLEPIRTVSAGLIALRGYLDDRFHALHRRDTMLLERMDLVIDATDRRHSRFIAMREILTRCGIREADFQGAPWARLISDAQRWWSANDLVFKRCPHTVNGYPWMFDEAGVEDWWEERGRSIFSSGHRKLKAPELALVHTSC